MKEKITLIGLVTGLVVLVGTILFYWPFFKEKTQQHTQASGPQEEKYAFAPPSMDDVPEGPYGEAVKYGYKLLSETNTALPDYVGNELSCISCHAGAGLEKHQSPFVGVTAVYPQYREREGKIMTIEDRINGCMIRSMNGKKLPYDSEEMKAMVAYLHYISEGIPVGAKGIPWRGQNTMENVPKPHTDNGKKLYNQSCMSCHAVDGSGTGPNTGPALWGDKSFNEGAGLARISKLAGFIQRNMPIGQENTLTDQEAADLAAYILSHDRPEFKGKDKDWPKGNKPDDVPY